jgi:hypothetical protein
MPNLRDTYGKSYRVRTGVRHGLARAGERIEEAGLG